MSKLTVYKCDQPVLRLKTAPVKNIDRELKKLVGDMWDTLYTANGVGLAANQVGVSLQVLVIDTRVEQNNKKIVLLNPKIITSSKDCLHEEEGCLSVPGVNAKVERSKKVKVEGLDLHGKKIEVEGEDLFSRALQHELDHLAGIVFIDRLNFWERLKALKNIRDQKNQGKW
ncbi:MAG: peptide deformylase [Elusimicrobiota bacterium]